MIVRDIGVTAGSSVILSCRTSPSIDVVHAEWDFRRHYIGKPILIYDGSIINRKQADKYDILCNLSSSVCDLRINRLQDSDAGGYQCYLNTNDRTFNFIHNLRIIGIFTCWIGAGPCRL